MAPAWVSACAIRSASSPGSTTTACPVLSSADDRAVASAAAPTAIVSMRRRQGLTATTVSTSCLSLRPATPRPSPARRDSAARPTPGCRAGGTPRRRACGGSCGVKISQRMYPKSDDVVVDMEGGDLLARPRSAPRGPSVGRNPFAMSRSSNSVESRASRDRCEASAWPRATPRPRIRSSSALGQLRVHRADLSGGHPCRAAGRSRE